VPWEKSKAQADLRGQLSAGWLPVEASSDHQVQDQKEILLQPEDEPFANPADLAHKLPVGLSQRRLDRAQQRRARHLDAVESVVHGHAAERVEIDGKVGQLRHAGPGRAGRWSDR